MGMLGVTLVKPARARCGSCWEFLWPWETRSQFLGWRVPVGGEPVPKIPGKWRIRACLIPGSTQGKFWNLRGLGETGRFLGEEVMGEHSMEIPPGLGEFSVSLFPAVLLGKSLGSRGLENPGICPSRNHQPCSTIRVSNMGWKSLQDHPLPESRGIPTDREIQPILLRPSVGIFRTPNCFLTENGNNPNSSCPPVGDKPLRTGSWCLPSSQHSKDVTRESWNGLGWEGTQKLSHPNTQSSPELELGHSMRSLMEPPNSPKPTN